MLCLQNGDRIVTIDSVTSLHPMYRTSVRIPVTKKISDRQYKNLHVINIQLIKLILY